MIGIDKRISILVIRLSMRCETMLNSILDTITTILAKLIGCGFLTWHIWKNYIYYLFKIILFFLTMLILLKISTIIFGAIYSLVLLTIVLIFFVKERVK